MRRTLHLTRHLTDVKGKASVVWDETVLNVMKIIQSNVTVNKHSQFRYFMCFSSSSTPGATN